MARRKGVRASTSSVEVGYPSWEGRSRGDEPRRKPIFDRSRRRFLRQLTAGGAGLCVGGLPALSAATGYAIDLSILDHHPPVCDTSSAGLPSTKTGGAKPSGAGDVVESGDDSGGWTPLAQSEVVEEDRALWVDPGYLILLRWRRPVDDSLPVSALEAATEALADFLEENAVGMDDLHDIDRLHQLEAELVALLSPLLAPAEIDVLHLDHDCTLVCDTLSPRTPPEPRPITMGFYKPVGWKS